MRPLRIAFGRLNQETNALSPVVTTLDDFKRTHYVEGDALLACCQPKAAEVKGFMRNLELSGFVAAAKRWPRPVEPVPLVSAWAISGGPIERAAYDAILDAFLARLRAAGPVDGVFVALHGAMGVVGLRDPETHFLQAVRTVVGDLPIAASFDLHGNLTKERIAAANILSGYHTNPHRDHARTAGRATRALLGIIDSDGKMPITTAWRTLPMLLGGGNTIDFLSPMRKVFSRLKKLLRDPRVVDASVFPVHPWNDDPQLGWSAIVHTRNDQALAETLADELAESLWSVRDVKPPAFSTAVDAVVAARRATIARKLGVVVFADASDVVSAGSVGENTDLLRVLLDEGKDLVSYVPIRDPEVAVELEHAAIGSTVTVELGGKLDPARTRPIPLTATVQSLHRDTPFGRVVVLTVGKTNICVTEGPPLVMKPSFFADLGLSVWSADVVVVKNFFPFRMFFLLHARKTIYVKTHGITDLDAAFAITFDGPMHPRDTVDGWRSRDRSRRGL